MTDSLTLIPYPQSLTLSEGVFVWNRPNLNYDPLFFNEANFLVKHLPEVYRIENNDQPDCNICMIAEKPQSLQPEAYQIFITPEKINLHAASKAGMFYGVQTLLQLIRSKHEPHAETPGDLPCLEIIDQPRFGWRGFMLDEARHFHGVKTVKSLLDWMAYFKLNTFHWHLTEDQGWRIEIKKYPLLTEIGAQRSQSQIGGLFNKTTNNMPHSGFYTQEEIREIIDYAAVRHINIVPEIEMPGHSLAALAAYPQFGCTGGPYQVSPHWGIFSDIYCVGKKETILFLEDILEEIISLFPGKYIHTGGDEAPKKNWKSCPDCQNKAQALNLKNVRGLQTYLANHFTRFLTEKERQLIGWNEILSPELSPDAIVQFWTGRENLLWNHVREGRKAILSNFAAYYLDHGYLRSALDKVYQYEPIPADLETEYHQNVLGIETPLWTEFVPNRARLDYQVFPRLIAVAESAWLMPEKKNYRAFEQRLINILPQLDADGILYAPLETWTPPRLKRLWGPFSIMQAQTKTR